MSALSKMKASITAAAAELNSEADRAEQMFAEAENFLTELNVGERASVVFDTIEVPSNVDPDDLDEAEGSGFSVTEYHELCYGRVNGRFRIHVAERVYRLDLSLDEGGPGVLLQEELTPWQSCSRAVKVRAFAKLTSLLRSIEQQVKKAASDAAMAYADVKEALSAD